MNQGQKFSEYTSLTPQEAVERLESDAERGLESQERNRRLAKYGANKVAQSGIVWHKILLRQFKSSFVYLLFGAAIIGFVLGELIDGITIMLFVAINAALGFYQEYRSEQTVQVLQRFTLPTSKALIGGKEQTVESRSLVPGDIIKLEAGDLRAADARLLVAHDLAVDESALTGESEPQDKSTEAPRENMGEIYQASCMVFAGTTVVRGWASALIVATGRSSVLGEVSKLANELPRESSFEKSLDRFSAFILRLVMVTIVLVFAANFAIKHDSKKLIEFAVFSIALAVSVIPEALPTVTTFSLSSGARRLARRKVVVKRLSAIEDLGSIEVLCTDKTGTLTENRLTIAEVYGADRQAVLASAALASSYFSKIEKHPDAFDLAIWDGLALPVRAELRKQTRIGELPFDPERRRNSVIVGGKSGQRFIVRGAAEAILPFCSASSVQQTQCREWVAEQGRQGRRVIVLASKNKKFTGRLSVAEEESQLGLIGCISFSDPIKATTIPAISQAEKLGVAVKILTGDSPEVAGSVGREVGLIRSPKEVLTGAEFERLPGEAQEQAVERYQVFARVSPRQKYRIIQLLEQKHTVGFLGEGINDAPALKIANVGLVVAGASDVAREASDIVLLKKSLEVIVNGIEEGRAVFANTIKYIKATLASNFGNFYAVAIASLLIDYLPMLPLQILLVNLLSDFPMIALATDTVDADEGHKPKSYQVRDIALLATVLGVTSTIFDFIFFAIYSRVSPGVLQTNWFIGSILTELVFIYSIRTKFFFARSSHPSHILVGLTAVAALLTILLPFTPLGVSVFHFTAPRISYLLLDLGLVAMYFVSTESVKLLYYRFAAPRSS